MSGLCYGYLPMLNGILEEIIIEFKKKGEVVRSIVQTGGEAKNYSISKANIHNSLTLEGLALAFIDEQTRC